MPYPVAAALRACVIQGACVCVCVRKSLRCSSALGCCRPRGENPLTPTFNGSSLPDVFPRVRLPRALPLLPSLGPRRALRRPPPNGLLSRGSLMSLPARAQDAASCGRPRECAACVQEPFRGHGHCIMLRGRCFPVGGGSCPRPPSKHRAIRHPR